MALARAGQCATGQHPNAHYADAGGLCVLEQPPVVLRRIVRRQRCGGRGIEHVVADLGTVEDPRIDHLVQRRGIADRRDSQEARLAALALTLEGRHQFFEDLPNAERVAAAIHGNGIVKVKDVDPLQTQPLQASVKRRTDGVGNAGEIEGSQPYLRANDCVGGFQFLENAAKIFSDSPSPYATAVSK